MKLRNDTDGVRTTRGGIDIQPGETLEVGDIAADELDWLERHGCSKPGAAPKPKPAAEAPVRRTRRRSFEAN